MARTRGITKAIKGGERKGGKKRNKGNVFADAPRPRPRKKLEVTPGTRGIEYSGKLPGETATAPSKAKHRRVEGTVSHTDKRARNAALQRVCGVIGNVE